MPSDAFHVVTKISHPIGIAALTIAVFYGVLYLLVKRLSFNKQGYRAIKLIVDKASNLALVALILGVAAFGLPPLLSLYLGSIHKPPELSKTERRLVSDLMNQVRSLRGDYEGSDTSKHLALQAADRAPMLADQLATLRDSDLGLGYRLEKYEALAYCDMVAADSNSAELDFSLKRALACTDAVRAGFQALDAILHSDESTLVKWATEDHSNDRLNFISAACLSSESLAGAKVDRRLINEALGAITPSYAAKFPPETNPPIAKVLGLHAETGAKQ